MMSEPWLSVIMPVYNGESHLSSALDSIILQEDKGIECIAVDGESTDGTLSILESYRDRIPLRILRRERESNWVIKTNYALSFARGEYVCFLHHDDLWLRHRLKTMKQLTEEYPEAVLLIHPSKYLDYEGNTVGVWNCPLPAVPNLIRPQLIIERLLVQNFISILGPIFKRQSALQVGGLVESLWYTADWDFWLKLAACGDSLYFPKLLSGFRIHLNSQTIVRSLHSQNFREQLEHVYEKHFALWQAPEHLKQRVRKTASFSIEVNIALASEMHGQRVDLVALFVAFVLLGPSGWYRYLRDSRIWERVYARLRARLGGVGNVKSSKQHEN